MYRSWQYIPLLETLKCLFSMPQMVDAVTVSCRPRNDDVIEGFCDGKLFKESVFFADPTRIAIPLDFYYDDMETANPLGSKATVHKVALIYFRVGLVK